MVHVQEAHMINIYTLGMDVESNNNDECMDNTSAQTMPVHENMPSYLGCIDTNGACLQNGLELSPEAVVGNRSPIVDLKLNSVESAILSSGSSRESSLSPQMIITNQHSHNGDNDVVSAVDDRHFPSFFSTVI